MQDLSTPNDIAYKITIGVLGLVAVILGIANSVVFLTPKPTNTPTPKNETANVDNSFDVDFDDLTKEQTIAAFRAMRQPGYIPKGFADQAVALNANETYTVLDYSYDSIDEINEIDYHVSNFGENEITATPVGDYYAVITTDDYKEKRSPSYWPKAVSFNKKYVNYYRDPIEMGLNEHVVFTDISSPVVQITLPVFAVTQKMTQPASIYSYDFVENTNDYTLTLNCIGASYDLEALSEISKSGNQSIAITDYPYVLTHYTATLRLNKETGEPSWDKGSTGGTTNLLRTFRLNEQEINDLAGYLVQV